MGEPGRFCRAQGSFEALQAKWDPTTAFVGIELDLELLPYGFRVPRSGLWAKEFAGIFLSSMHSVLRQMQVFTIISIYESQVAFKSFEFISCFIILWHKYSHCPHVTDENTEAPTKPHVARGKAGAHTKVLQAPEPCFPFIPHPSWGLGPWGQVQKEKELPGRVWLRLWLRCSLGEAGGCFRRSRPHLFSLLPTPTREVLPSFTAFGTKLVATASHELLMNSIITVHWVLLCSHPTSSAFLHCQKQGWE